MVDVFGNLWLVSVVLLPVVCAMSVWAVAVFSGLDATMAGQAGMVGASGMAFWAVLPPSELKLLLVLMGLTSVALSTIISRFVAQMRAGGDRVEFYSSIGKACLVSAGVYTLSFILLTTMIGGV
jgi:hypothetical protein